VQRDATVGVAVDVVPLAIDGGRLHAALVPVANGRERRRLAFPGGRVRESESLDDAAARWLGRWLPASKAHVEQLYTFGEPGRDPASRVVSVAYLALLARPLAAPDVVWRPCDTLPRLAYDHGTIARVAVERLRGKLAYTNLAFALLDRTFTLAELQQVYEAVLGRPLDRRNFRKRVLSLGLLTPLPETRHGAHRPARLYRFATRRPITLERAHG
jgi:8-oxo-dGTP diphosphatase